MRKKTQEQPRTPAEQCAYLAGCRDNLRRQLKTLTKDLSKIEEELQAATFAAGQSLAAPAEIDRQN
ncbi:hypothetical protein [Trichloromonas sp.]|uniref:hypothetical protein n=1 Tax=Trichloromonas sp. TaxID=3069249 RepID=UPI002A4DF5C8|nr:hypothetical protein [Trichloromonas sp.]